ncbi:MAG: helix-turn-helix domain-containing protein [Candidatus Thorarchaeota archaeon]|nr:MAG: helix-turn-helix domain-containing protein [Candidatus Thorarchaeota archaeon]
MSGGSTIDPYYHKDTPRKSKKGRRRKVKHSRGPRKITINAEDVRRLYFDRGLTQAQVANALKTTPDVIRHVFRDNEWEAKRSRRIDEAIRRLYFDDRLTKSEIARRLGISLGTLYRAFERNRWVTLPKQWPTKSDPEEARNLYEEGLPLAEIAKNLGVSVSTVKTYLRSTGAKRRVRPPFKSETQRQKARKEQALKARKKIQYLRDKLFGKECKVCGVDGNKRKLGIHKKDFTEHKLNALWRLSFLKKVNHEEWSALCTMCHRGVHWAKDDLGIDWPAIEDNIKRKSTEESERGLRRESKSAMHLEKKSNGPASEAEDFRKALFGDECYFCGPMPAEKRLVIHRKDGESHRRGILWSEEHLQRMDPDEWQALCQKHHRYVHWAMKYLGLKWNDIESAFQGTKNEQ